MNSTLRTLAEDARAASVTLARLDSDTRTQCLLYIGRQLRHESAAIMAANAKDMINARASGLSEVMMERLLLSENHIEAMAKAVESIAQQNDPVGETTKRWTQDNGLEITKVRAPLGVILMIYESRPNVTIDAAALCIRSGNAVILRGGSEADHSNRVLAECITAALQGVGMPTAAVQRVPTQDRTSIDTLLTFDTLIDLVIPRGGPGLIRHVAQHSRIPVIRHDQGICHVFVDAKADCAMAERIAVNAKVARPGVCNAMETLLVDQAITEKFLPSCLAAMTQAGVEIRGCARTCVLFPDARAATDADWDTEFLGLVLAVRVVDSMDAAIAHIDAHGSHHTASIVTDDPNAAERFVREVDASCVLVNASTRFNDGGSLGLGAEMGISTTKVHAYGPMGVESLCTERFVVYGNGQTR